MKKIITSFLLISLLITISCTALATSVLPTLPDTGNTDWIVYKSGDTYRALNYTWRSANGFSGDLYDITNGEWNKTENGSYSLNVSNVVYDVLGVYGPSDSDLFPKPAKPIESSDWAEIYEAFSGQITVRAVADILVVLVGACASLVFMWWGVRKLIRALMSAWKKGRVSL